MKPMTLQRLKQSQCGIAAVEFALILPLMILIFTGLLEVGRYAQFIQKTDKAASDMADLVTQNSEATLASLNGYADALNLIMDPFDLDGTVIVTSVAALSKRDADALDAVVAISPTEIDANIPPELPPQCHVTGCVVWQWKRGPDSSLVGTTGGEAHLPGGYDIRDATHNVLAVEVVNRFHTLTGFGDNFINTMLQPVRRTVVLKPRQQGGLLVPPQ